MIEGINAICSLFLVVMDDPEIREWAFSQLGHAEIPDLRNRKRLVRMAAQAARVDGGTITQVFCDPSERDAVYDFVENKRICAEPIQHAAAVAAARELSREPYAWLVVDGTSLTLPDSHKTKGMGRLGSGQPEGTGVKVITCLALDAQGVPHGIGEFSWWVRTGPKNKVGKGKVRIPNGKRPVEQKETLHWLEVVQNTRATWAQTAPGVRRWWVIDREADTITMLHSVDQHGDWFTIRSNVNRRLVAPQSGGFTFVREAVAAQPVREEFVLRVPGSPKRRARQARMELRSACVTLDMRENWSKKRRPITLNVVWVREVGTTPLGEKPIEWLLYTNHNVDCTEDLYLVVYGYMQRWRVEDFHRTWKRGACRVEDSRLCDVSHVKIWATVLATVAIRIERLKLRSRTAPDTPAAEEFSEYELKAIRGIKRKQGVRVPDELTLEQAVHYVAEFGGYTGKSSGGPPGSTVIGRGLERLQFVVEGIRVAEEMRQASTSRTLKTKRN
jgi:hypothetical protein